MSRRTEPVEVQLQREIAGILLRGDLRDPRLTHVASLSITGARVSADLSTARVFFDVADEARAADITEALNAGTPRIRSLLAGRLDMRRVPAIRFERDVAIEQGTKMEALFADLERERRRIAAESKAEGSLGDASDTTASADPAPAQDPSATPKSAPAKSAPARDDEA